jgi:hypothetical protein
MLSLVAAFGTMAGLAFSLALLFLPTLIARSRNHPHVSAIFLVNLFFGWTFIGWVVSLIWASTRPGVPVSYAPAYPLQYPAARNGAVTILPPSVPYRRAR